MNDQDCTPPQMLMIGDWHLSLLYQDHHFAGIGDITHQDGLAMRCGQIPMLPQLHSPFATTLLNWQIVEHGKTSNGGYQLVLNADRRDGGLMEFMLHTVRQRVHTNTSPHATRPAVGTTLTIHLNPITRLIGGRLFSGFKYQYEYDSPDIPIYRIIDQASWESGGQAVGNEIWMRGAEPAIFDIQSDNDFYSSEWYLPGIANPNIFQFKPLQTHLQGFTFTASDKGILVTWSARVHHIRSLIQKDHQAAHILHVHEHCGDMDTHLVSAPMEVLFWSCPGPTRVERANCYDDVKQLVHETLHRDIGMCRERVATSGMIEQWELPDIHDYTRRGLPKLLDIGVRNIELANHFQNNMNVYGLSNMCCTLDLKVADSVGEENLRVFCQKAAEGGARVRMWANTALSTMSRLFYGQDIDADTVPTQLKLLPEENSPALQTFRSPQAWVRDPSGSVEADHYRPRFAVMNLRDPGVWQYWFDAWQHAHDHIGLEGFFLDSSFNLTSDKFHWYQDQQARHAGGATADQAHLLIYQRPTEKPIAAVQSLYHVHLEMVKQMQRIGYTYCGEDLGVFGIHRCGWNLAANLDKLYLWADCLQNFDVPALLDADADPDEVYFRALAYRVMWLIHWNPRHDCLSFHTYEVRDEYDRPSDEHLALLEAYNHIESFMYNRQILPDEAGVIYRHHQTLIVWSFKPTELSLPAKAHTVVEVLTGQTLLVTNGTLQTESRQLLMITPTLTPIDTPSTALNTPAFLGVQA